MSTITITTPPSKLAVGDTPGDDWQLARHNGNRVRYQNKNNAAWDKAFNLEPGDEMYRALDHTFYTPEELDSAPDVEYDTTGGPDGLGAIETAPESTAQRLSDNMGVIDPTDPPLELDDLSDVPSASSSFPEADVEYAYESMTRDQLRKIASERNIKGRGSMSKAELIEALRN